jgi:hypothetical protein
VVQIRTQDLLSDAAVSIVATALKAQDIERGSLLSIDEGGTRVRMLPLKGSQGPTSIGRRLVASVWRWKARRASQPGLRLLDLNEERGPRRGTLLRGAVGPL